MSGPSTLEQPVNQEPFEAVNEALERRRLEGRLVPPLTSLSQVSRGARLRSTTPTNGAKAEGVQTALAGLEERMNAQITRIQQQGDRLREVALTRMEAKVSTVEALQPKFDRRMAELSGSVKGLSDEMQSQLRRVDQIDGKLWDWRHQIEEELRSRLAEVEQSLQQLGSTQRVAKAAAEDGAKKFNMRLLRLEGLTEEHHSHAEDTNGSLAQLNLRIEELEESHGLQHVHHDEEIYAHVEKIRVRDAEWQLQQSTLEERFLEHSLSTQGLQQKFDALQQESSDLRARLEIQEEKVRSLRTLQDAKDEQLRTLIDRVERENLEGRVKSVQQRVQELESAGVSQTEQLQLLQHSLDRQEQDVQHLSRLPSPRYPPSEDSQILSADRGERRAAERAAAAASARVEKLEEQLQRVAQSLKALESEQSLTPLTQLLSQLKEIAPKVISHGHEIQLLHRKVAALEQRPAATTMPVLAQQEPATLFPPSTPAVPSASLEVTEALESPESLESPAASPGDPGDPGEEVATSQRERQSFSVFAEEAGSPQLARAEWQLQQAAQRRAGEI